MLFYTTSPVVSLSTATIESWDSFVQLVFFHDVFHGFTHSCSAAFKCSHLRSFDGINSSICEQFNSFIQKIKMSGKLMGQARFVFYLQFFIKIWNEKKRVSFQDKLKIVIESDR